MSTAGSLRRNSRRALAIAAALLGHGAVAATTVLLPPSSCSTAPVSLHASGFEDNPSRPSLGSGGEIGYVTRDIEMPGGGLQRYFLHVPEAYDPTRPIPLVVLLHGQAGSSPGAAEAVASFTRNDWGPVVNAARIIVLAPVGPSPQGSWYVPESFGLIQAGIADTLARYNVDASRVHGWGFSAGANTLHALALSQPGLFASYAVHAGSLRRAAGVNAPAAAARKVPVQLWVGVNDAVYLPETLADRTVFRNAGWIDEVNLRYTEHSGGHNYDTDQFHLVWQHACRFAVVP